MTRHATRVLLLLGALAPSACRPASAPVPVVVVDFIKELDRAELRPPSAYVVTDSPLGGAPLTAIVGPAPGRLTWTLPVPHHAAMRVQLAASGTPVRVRIGVSDARIYEQLLDVTISPGAAWNAQTVDLSAYAGRKVSLFYQPDRQQWRINLSADAVSGPGTVAWGMPAIVASRDDALEFARRRVRLTRSGAP